MHWSVTDVNAFEITRKTSKSRHKNIYWKNAQNKEVFPRSLSRIHKKLIWFPRDGYVRALSELLNRILKENHKRLTLAVWRGAGQGRAIFSVSIEKERRRCLRHRAMFTMFSLQCTATTQTQHTLFAQHCHTAKTHNTANTATKHPLCTTQQVGFSVETH